MKNYELVIDDKLKDFDLGNIDDVFMKLYGACDVCPSGIEKLDLLFACYHDRLYSLITPLSRRIKESNNQQAYYWAESSRGLIKAINDIFELQKDFKGTCFNFTLSQECSDYLKYIRPFLNLSGGSPLPEGARYYDIPKYERLFWGAGQNGSEVPVEPSIDEKIQMVSTRGATFDQMALDERLGVLSDVIENLLNKKDKFVKVDPDAVFCGLITNDEIMSFRKKLHCFRHGKEGSIEERKKYSKNQKEFMSNYGLIICTAILNNPKEK